MSHSSEPGVAASAARQRPDSVEGATEPPAGTPYRDPVTIRVLVVSGFLLFRAGVARVLETAGISVVGEATTCEDAIPAARDGRPDVILLDLDSRRGDIYECVGQLVSAVDSSRVIGLSDPDSADWTRLVELGGVGLVLKSQPPELLIKAIQKVHAGELWLDRTHTARVFSDIVARRRRADVQEQRIASLTRREREIVELVGEGLKNAAIGERLFISDSTVRNHLTSIFGKLGVDDRFELVVYAFKHGLVRYATSGTKHTARGPV